MAVLGITGGIGTGKTTFRRILEGRFEAVYFDSDRVARRLMEEDEAVLAEVRREFGGEIFDPSGRVDRGRLRDRVFRNAEERKALEAILHPRIRSQWLEEAAFFAGRKEWMVVDIPLLYEVGVERHFNRIVVVACSRETQFLRLTANRGLSPEMANRMIASQQCLETKMRKADFVIWSDSPLETLETQAELLVEALHENHR